MNDELYHHGIKGQKWGVRRYQNPDGSLTEAGRKKYGAGRKDKGSFVYDYRHKGAYDSLRKRVDRADKKASKMRKRADASRDKERAKTYRHAADALDTAAILKKKAMNKSLKEIGMSKKELAFREAGYEYTKHLNGSIRNKLLLEIGINPIFGAAIYTAYRASTPKGKELERRQYETGKAYKAEIDAYRSNR